MLHLARTLRAIAVAVGLMHWAASSLGAQEFFEPGDVLHSVAYRAERAPPFWYAPQSEHATPSIDGLDDRFEPPPEENLLGLPPGASTEWPGPGPSDASTALDETDHEGLSVRERFGMELGNLWSDFGNYYCRWPTYRNLAIAFGVGAALANTSADDQFQEWYESHVHSGPTDHAATFFRTFGAGWIMIPSWAGLGLVGAYFDDSPYGNIAADFGLQTTRAILVGAPALIFAQYATGGGRPDLAPFDSHWHPFQNSHGVSGHAFIGAVPFLTAARMVESPWLKGLLYFGSALPGWSRIEDDKHFLSQVILGWCMAYVACEAVAETEATTTSVTVMPVVSERMVGMGILFQY